SEVVLYAFAEWGKECVHRFNGMFAFAVFDSVKNNLVLCRDRMGVKPLYYFHTSKHFVFASELKSIYKYPFFEKKITLWSVGNYLANGYIDAPHSIFEHTAKLSPGHFLELEIATNKKTITRYWSIYDCYRKPKLQIDYNTAKDVLEEKMSKAFQYRLIADVPVGVFLSGGYDSSAVAAILQKRCRRHINTFTIGFRETDFDESHHARAVARHLGCTHHELLCTPDDALGLLDHYSEVYDEPFGDTSALPTMLVSKLARDYSVKVALSADGGDELFAGYNRYANALKKIKLLGWLPGTFHYFSKMFPLKEDLQYEDKFGKLTEFLKAKEAAEKYAIIIKSFSDRLLRKLLKEQHNYSYHIKANEDLSSVALLEQILAYDAQTYLADDILHKVDRATMGMSIEGREPFLDVELIEFVAQLPVHFKTNQGLTKRILKEIVWKYIPKNMMERPKHGFGIPLEQWLRNELREQTEFYFSEQFINAQQIFCPRLISKMKNSFLQGKDIPGERVGRLFLFQKWWHRWIKN
ncbi:MAG: asparagine synthase (glutamine-hydrolyzing), partial [Chitinophagales bacterium]|nr:asparagine synthase (glutamine-hydrolyzing) [Chitinophagales bacterium]